MRILFITGHPAQIHNFRLIKKELERKGHQVYWLASAKDISINLLEKFNIQYQLLKKPNKGKLSKIIALIKNVFFSLKFLRQQKIDIVVSRISPYLSISSFLLRKSHIALTDTESAGFYDWFFAKFTNIIITAKSYNRKIHKNQVRFDANIELFYLHPKRFQSIKRNDVEKLLNIGKDEPYIIMRFVSWDAFHDKGLSGFTDANKKIAVKEYSKYAKVFISSEKDLPSELASNKINISIDKMHDVLKYAALFFGESSTMASESAVLGTPAIFLNENWFGSTDEEKEFGLLFSYKQSLNDQQKAIEKGIELLTTPNLEIIMQKNQQKFLLNKIDVTAFMVWFIENYPQSAKIMKENPDYQYRFK